MAYTITTGVGSNVAAGTNPTPAYPASGLAAGKLAALQLFIKNDASGTLTPPAGWTQRGSTATVGSDSQSVWTRELDGSETPGGTITVTSTGTGGRRAALIIVIDTAGGTGWNFENIDSENSGATPVTTVSDNSVTTSGNNRLAVNFIGYSNRQTGGQENLVGETGGSWVASAYYDGGSNPTLSVETAELSSAGTINGGSDTTINSSVWIIHGMSIWRNASALPDLTVTDISWNSTSPAVGRPLTFSAEVTNAGSAATPSGVIHGVKFEVNSNTVAFATSWMTSILPSSAATIVADGTWTPTTSASSATVVATVDYAGLISESTEANNTRTETIAIIDLPNFQVTDISWSPASPVLGDSVIFSAAVKNAGLASFSSGTVIPVNFDVSGSQVATANSYVGGIASSSTATITADSAWIPSVSGTFGVVATVNPAGTLDESNLTDNSFSENITINVSSSAIVTKFAGRGPGSDGNITPILSDYDAFFLTQGEGDDRYLQTVPAEYLTESEGDARYLQAVPIEYVTQAEADAQGMPAIEAGAVGSNTPVRLVNANFTLLAPSQPANYWQSYYNVASGAVVASAPAGYTLVGSNSIAADSAALFVKLAGVSQFRRWS